MKIIESSAECQAEWNLVRNKMLAARIDQKRTDDFWWEFINDDACIKFPNILKLKRFFSKMNLTKSHLNKNVVVEKKEENS